MENNKPIKNLRYDVVQRYCPHICENVVMRRSADGGPTRFECLSASSCPCGCDLKRGCADAPDGCGMPARRDGNDPEGTLF